MYQQVFVDYSPIWKYLLRNNLSAFHSFFISNSYISYRISDSSIIYSPKVIEWTNFWISLLFLSSNQKFAKCLIEHYQHYKVILAKTRKDIILIHVNFMQIFWIVLYSKYFINLITIYLLSTISKSSGRISSSTMSSICEP